MPESARPIVRFGVFEVDLRSGELRKAGRRVAIQEQPFRILVRLLHEPGDLVTREELRQELWPAHTFVDFERSLNAGVSRLRDALGDTADASRFIETIPKRGYRFVAPTIGDPVSHAPAISGRWRSVVGLPIRVLVIVALLGAGALPTVWWMRTAPRAGRVSLAVLPLKHLGDAADESLANGLTDEITTALARVNPGRLAIIARTSAARYASRSKSVREIGRDLDVDYVLEGTVRHTNRRVRISVQLIEAKGESQLWAQAYNRDAASIFDIESQIAETVAAQLAVRLLSERRPVRAPDPEAHVAYLQGLHFWNRRSEASLRRAIERFRQALERDPGYARAHAGLASAYASLATSADAVPADEARQMAETSARRALELDPALPEAHAVMAAVACRLDWEWAECERHLRRTLDLDPNYATGRHLLGEHLLQRARFDEAVAELTRARTADPLSPSIHTHLGLAHMYARRYGEALPFFAQAIEIDRDYVLAHRVRGLTLVRAGRVEEGLATLRHARSLEPDSARAAADLGYALALAGRLADARAMLRDLDALARRRPVSAYDFAVVSAGLGDTGVALDWLERAYAHRASGLRWLKIEPIFDRLRQEPRFQALIRNLAIPE